MESTYSERMFLALQNRINNILKSLECEEDQNRSSTIPLTEQSKCAICLERAAVIRTFPCKHTTSCKPCFVLCIQSACNQLREPPSHNKSLMPCIICRTPIQRALVCGSEDCSLYNNNS